MKILSTIFNNNNNLASYNVLSVIPLVAVVDDGMSPGLAMISAIAVVGTAGFLCYKIHNYLFPRITNVNPPADYIPPDPNPFIPTPPPALTPDDMTNEFNLADHAKLVHRETIAFLEEVRQNILHDESVAELIPEPEIYTQRTVLALLLISIPCFFILFGIYQILDALGLLKIFKRLGSFGIRLLCRLLSFKIYLP